MSRATELKPVVYFTPIDKSNLCSCQSGEYGQLQHFLSTIPELKDDDESLREMRAIFMVSTEEGLP